MKAHDLTGDGAWSKIRTQHVSLSWDLLTFLANVTEVLVVCKVEVHSIHIWAAVESKPAYQPFSFTESGITEQRARVHISNSDKLRRGGW